MSFVGQDQSSNISLAGMYTQLIINSVLGISILIAFSFLRPRNGIVYAPKANYTLEKNQVSPKIKDVDNPLQQLTVANIKNVNWLWANVTFTWLFSALLYYRLFKECNYHYDLHKKFFKSNKYQRSLYACTLLLKNLGNHIRNDDDLRNYVLSIKNKFELRESRISKEIGNLPKLIKKRKKYIQKLKYVITQSNPNYITSKEIENVKKYTNNIEQLDNNINRIHTDKSGRELLNHGVVSFTRITSAHKFMNIKNIETTLPFTHGISKDVFISGFMETYFAPLVMVIFFLLLPDLFHKVAMFQGKISKTSLDRLVIGKLYFFFILNNIIIFTSGTTLMDLWTNVWKKINKDDSGIDDVYSVIEKTYVLKQITSSIIKVSSFWINYISLRGFSTVFDLAQVTSFVTKYITRLFIKPTPHNILKYKKPPYFNYPAYYNIYLFFFTIGILYSMIAPLILVFCLGYFLLSLINNHIDNTLAGGNDWSYESEGCMDSLVSYHTIANNYGRMDTTNDESLEIFEHPSSKSDLINPMIHTDNEDSLYEFYRGEHINKINNRHYSYNTKRFLSIKI
ncbi:15308_t:CDS:2, partial [Dentiscutata heterogama]